MEFFDRTALERAGLVPGRAGAIRRDDATAQEKHGEQHTGRGREASQIHGALSTPKKSHTPMGGRLFRGIFGGFRHPIAAPAICYNNTHGKYLHPP
jgi:hypothetical protein